MAFEVLKKRWAGLPFKSPLASETELNEFEAQHDIALPADLRSFFAEVNGSGDEFEFRFLPLKEVVTVEKLSEMQTTTLTSPEAGRFFVFVDYMQWCWGYAIRLGETVGENIVVPIGKLARPVIASSFSDFVELYLRDDQRLYLG